ncbi:hypothetical protein [Tautonia marina]|uniref:hypothetical protein n=1 Tax=Tautonia marina TaxID=2653855 RepID=UPI001261205D|nr:hypothetical protein [Tautonia marina]
MRARLFAALAVMMLSAAPRVSLGQWTAYVGHDLDDPNGTFAMAFQDAFVEKVVGFDLGNTNRSLNIPGYPLIDPLTGLVYGYRHWMDTNQKLIRVNVGSFGSIRQDEWSIIITSSRYFTLTGWGGAKRIPKKVTWPRLDGSIFVGYQLQVTHGDLQNLAHPTEESHLHLEQKGEEPLTTIILNPLSDEE